MRKTVIRTLYLIAGSLCVILGLIGVLLPLLPTTPFMLLAAFCFSRSSERLHQALLNNRIVGKIIRDWEENGVIPLKAKILASSMMLLMVSYPLIFRTFHIGLKAMVVVTIIIALGYIWSRPSVPQPKSPAGSVAGFALPNKRV
ncbi:YbaN family protein [Neptuniibacter halophilus]|uniref:YbaN family protein n=1 Tax=Neptuniibacter halophilus TaxID=651666 RepID=UPI0025728481|nr:YbaN family protein [Neptuniibacter halophilus]